MPTPIIRGAKSKTRDLEAPDVKGATPRAFQTHPTPNSTDGQKRRGTSNQKLFKFGSIPNK